MKKALKTGSAGHSSQAASVLWIVVDDVRAGPHWPCWLLGGMLEELHQSPEARARSPQGCWPSDRMARSFHGIERVIQSMKNGDKSSLNKAQRRALGKPRQKNPSNSGPMERNHRLHSFLRDSSLQRQSGWEMCLSNEKTQEACVESTGEELMFTVIDKNSSKATYSS